MSLARREAEKEKLKKRSAVVPIIALVLVISLGVISFFAAPMLIDALKENNEEFATRVYEVELEINEEFEVAGTGYSRLDIAIAIFLWIVLLAISGMVVAGALGGDMARKEDATLRPVSKDPKAIQKYDKKLEKIRKQKMKEVRKLKEIQDREMRKRGQR